MITKEKDINMGDYERKLARALLKDALYTYTFDVTTGVIEHDVVSKNGFNYTKALGLTSPCDFDEMTRRSFECKHLHISYTLDSASTEISCAELIKAYESGRRRVEIKVYFEEKSIYSRLTYMLDRDDTTGHIMCYVMSQDITEIENQWIRENESAMSELKETDNILSCAEIGIWGIYLFDGEKPRMKASPKMRELLGIDSPEMTEEEIYDSWHSRIKKSSIPSVEASVAEMIEKGISENTYVWIHPKHGEIYVRCGGTSRYVEGKGYVLCGYHSDVTEIINSDIKQKQLLADALEEAEKQKALLQEALDNYKQADYDRRTDFLTGLRNRQDLYDLLQDNLSGKRDNIRTMYMMDIDNFKLLNDNYGHTVGDEYLRSIGKALIEYGKTHNMHFYRYGGEEILGVSFDSEKSANETADELVRLISGLGLKRDDTEAGVVTISLGYTSDNISYEKMIDKADAAMYKAKASGKNKAVCYEES